MKGGKILGKQKEKMKCSASAGVGAFDTDQFGDNHEINDRYNTNELDSDMECEVEGVHKYTMFKIGMTMRVGLSRIWPTKRLN